MQAISLFLLDNYKLFVTKKFPVEIRIWSLSGFLLFLKAKLENRYRCLKGIAERAP